MPLELPRLSTSADVLSDSSFAFVADKASLSVPLAEGGRISQSLLFIDSSVSDYQQLVSAAAPGVEVHVLNSAQDAVTQITDALLGRSGISSLHIVSHGQGGELAFGSNRLNLGNLPGYAAQVQSWGQALTDDADILLYGCDVAQGELGQAFAQILGQLTEADVAASDDWTGNSALGGDWTLEIQTGKIEAGLAFQPTALSSYDHILPVFSNSTNIDIQGSGNANPYPAAIDVTGLSSLVSGLTVTLTNFSHTFPDDVDILLVGPTGQSVLLMSDIGAGNRAENLTLTLSDAAADNLPNDTAIAPGTYRPTNYDTRGGSPEPTLDSFPTPAPGSPYGSALSVFNGTNPNGAWNLFIVDDEGGDAGSIAGGWSLDITLLNTPPTLTLPGGAVSYTEDSSPLAIAPLATLIDDSADFIGGNLTVSFSTGGSPDDHLSILSTDDITLDGRIVSHLGNAIGTINQTGGYGSSNPLVVSFTSANATPAAAQALLRAIAFSNTSQNPSTTARTLSVTVNDGSLSSPAVTQTINVTPINDAPTIGGATTLYAANGTSPGTQGWVAVIPPGATETPGAGSVNLNTTANPSLYAGYGRTDIPLDRATGYTINFSAQIPSSPTIASADKNGDGLPDRAGFSVIAVSSDLRAIELGFLATGIFAQEDGTRQSNPSQQASDPGSLTSTLFTQGESVNYATSTSTNYSLTVQGSTYTLAANGDVILTGNLRDYRATTTSFPTPNPYIVPNTIFFGDDTTSASASVNLGSVTINRNAPVSASGLEDTPIAIPPLALTDLDGVGNITVTLTAAQGNITVNPSIVGGVLVSNITNNGTGTVTLTGNLSQLNATLTGNGLSYQGNLNVNGSDTLTLTVNDGSGAANASASKTVAITIAPVNDAPSFTPGANQTVNAGAGAQTIANFASFNPGAANEAEQTATYTIVSNSNPSLFSGQPTINPDGTLTYTPVASLSSSQSATITVQVQDNGGTLNGGIDTSTIQEFTITVNPIDTPPVIPPPVTPPVTPPVIPPVAPPVAPPVNPPAPPVTPPVTPLTRTTANDFDGDGIADLLITRANFPIKGLQPTTNTYSLILSSTDTFASITTLTSNFQLVATTDFNGDGNTDLLWRNTANNTYSTWFLSGNTYIGGGIIASVSSNFEVVSSADFNGDGKADLIWKNTANNTYSTWLLSSNTYIGGGTIASLSSNFELLGTGDYNGDGRADLLWRDSSSNTYSNWLLNGNTYIGGGTIAALSSNFEIAFSADYNGDGCDDILWRDGNSNSYSNWFLNGSTYIGGGTIATLPVNFEVVSSRDYNGDGCADLVWLNRSNGALSEWFLNGFTYLDGDEVGTLGANEEVRR